MKSFSSNQIEKAFDEVANPRDWKAPIKAWVDPKDLELYREAIAFYTATTTSVVDGPRPKDGKVLIQATGYRMGPAGDY